MNIKKITIAIYAVITLFAGFVTAASAMECHTTGKSGMSCHSSPIKETDPDL